MNINLPDEALTEVVRHVGGTYDEVTKAAAKVTGSILGDLLSIIYYPLRLLKSKLDIVYDSKIDAFEKELNERIESIPQERRIEPNRSFIMRTLENSKYSITEDDLRAMFVNLISNSLDSLMVNICHPSFSDIIKQMTPAEAIIIKSFFSSSVQPILSIRYCHPESVESNVDLIDLLNGTFYYSDELSLFDQDIIDISLSNLMRLELLTVDYGYIIPEDDNYNAIMENAHRYITKNVEAGAFSKIDNFDEKNVEYTKAIVKLTDFGKAFIKVCYQ